MTEPVLLVFQFLKSVVRFILNWWWVAGPVVFGPVVWNSWMDYKHFKTLVGFNWKLLEIKIPPDVEKSPLAMEQVFAVLQGALYKGAWWRRYIQGRIQEWFSLEAVSVGGDLHFYIRMVNVHRNQAEAAIYAQYPQAEIYEVEDYTLNVPEEVPNETHNLFGAELVLAKEDPYPIRTYKDFEFETKEGVGNVDPIAAMTESMAKLKDGEQYWIQINAIPIDWDWKKKGDEIVAKLMGKPKKAAPPGSYMAARLKKEIGDYVSGLAQAPFKYPEYDPFEFGSPKKSDGPASLMQYLSPGEREIVEGVEKKISKVGFKTTIRVIYIARKEVFYVPTFFSVVASLRQLGTQHMNSIKWNGATITAGKFPFKKNKENFRKKWLLYKYRRRRYGQKTSVFNIEELATIFHFPGRIVASPTMPRIQAKRGEPPTGLPTF